MEQMKLTMKKWLLKNKWEIIGVFIGAIAGFIYHKEVGCSSGSCAITSNPYNSTIYFAIMGGLAAGIIKPGKKPNKNQVEE